jgi:hypothetical protein
MDPIPSAFDKFVAALTTLYRRFSVQLDFAFAGFFTWLFAQTPADQAAFLAHLPIPAWLLPPLIFLARSALVATPQPKVLADTAVKAEVRAEAKADAKP